MPLEEIYQRGKCKAGRKNIKGGPGHLQRSSLKFVDIFIAVASHAPYHVPYADAGNHLDKRIHPETEEGDGSVLKSEEDGYYALDEIVEYGDERKGICPSVKSPSLGVLSK